MCISEMSGENSKVGGSSDQAGGGNPDGEEGEGHRVRPEGGHQVGPEEGHQGGPEEGHQGGPGSGSWLIGGDSQQESGKGRAKVGDECADAAAR